MKELMGSLSCGVLVVVMVAVPSALLVGVFFVVRWIIASGVAHGIAKAKRLDVLPMALIEPPPLPCRPKVR